MMTEQERTEILRLKKRAQKDIEAYDTLLGISGESAWTRFQKMTPYGQGEYIISGICDFYEIPRKDFAKKTKNAIVARRRYYAVKLMDQYADIDQDTMAHFAGFANHSQANHAIKEMNERLSDKFYGDKNTKTVYSNIVEYLEFPHR